MGAAGRLARAARALERGLVVVASGLVGVAAFLSFLSLPVTLLFTYGVLRPEASEPPAWLVYMLYAYATAGVVAGLAASEATQRALQRRR